MQRESCRKVDLRPIDSKINIWLPFSRLSFEYEVRSIIIAKIQRYCTGKNAPKLYGRYGDLIQQYEVFLSRMLNVILTLDQQWLPSQSDFPPISWPWYPLWPSPNYEWFPRSICNRCGMPEGNAYPSGHLIPSSNLGLANAPIVETKLFELAMSLLDFLPRIPLGTFSILLWVIGTYTFNKFTSFCMEVFLLWQFTNSNMLYNRTDWITEQFEHVLEKSSAYKWQIAKGQQRS